LGSLKVIVLFPLILFFSMTVGVGIGFIHWFRLAPQLFWMIAKREWVTWRLSIVVMLGAIVPVVGYLGFMPLVGVGVALFFGVGMPFMITFEATPSSGNSPFAICEVFERTWDFTVKWWELGTELERTWRQMRTEQLPAGELPYDISLVTILLAVFMTAIGFAFLLPVWTFIVLLKFLPATFTLMTIAGTEAWDWIRSKEVIVRFCCYPFWCCSFLLTPIPCVFYLVVELLRVLGVCFIMPLLYYNLGWKDTLLAMLYLLSEYDRRTTGIMHNELGCCCGFRHWSLFEYCLGQPPDDMRQMINDLVTYSDKQSPAMQGQ